VKHKIEIDPASNTQNNYVGGSQSKLQVRGCIGQDAPATRAAVQPSC
jgi:hypothetical protein